MTTTLDSFLPDELRTKEDAAKFVQQVKGIIATGYSDLFKGKMFVGMDDSQVYFGTLTNSFRELSTDQKKNLIEMVTDLMSTYHTGFEGVMALPLECTTEQVYFKFSREQFNRLSDQHIACIIVGVLAIRDYFDANFPNAIVEMTPSEFMETGLAKKILQFSYGEAKSLAAERKSMIIGGVMFGLDHDKEGELAYAIYDQTNGAINIADTGDLSAEQEEVYMNGAEFLTICYPSGMLIPDLIYIPSLTADVDSNTTGMVGHLHPDEDKAIAFIRMGLLTMSLRYNNLKANAKPSFVFDAQTNLKS